MRDLCLVTVVHVTVSDGAGEDVERILAYMAQHCEDAILAGVAARFGFHPNTVSGLLKRHTGKALTDMLRHLRMERAASLLRDGLPVSQVAPLCGYENPSNFYRAFKAAFGQTPRAYVAGLGA